jgi:hypothetical protein
LQPPALTKTNTFSAIIIRTSATTARRVQRPDIVPDRVAAESSTCKFPDVEAVWQQRCPECGATMWRRYGGEWSCSRCSMGMRVRCPKATTLEATSS